MRRRKKKNRFGRNVPIIIFHHGHLNGTRNIWEKKEIPCRSSRIIRKYKRAPGKTVHAQRRTASQRRYIYTHTCIRTWGSPVLLSVVGFLVFVHQETVEGSPPPPPPPPRYSAANKTQTIIICMCVCVCVCFLLRANK